MAITRGVALVTSAEVAALTHEDGLSRLDGDTPASGATLANALITATDHLIILLETRAAGPVRVDLVENTSHSALKLASAHLVAYVCLKGQPSESQQARAKLNFDEAKRLVEAFPPRYTGETDEGYDKPIAPGLPTARHLDRYPSFRRAVDTTRPTDPPSVTGWRG